MEEVTVLLPLGVNEKLAILSNISVVNRALDHPTVFERLPEFFPSSESKGQLVLPFKDPPLEVSAKMPDGGETGRTRGRGSVGVRVDAA
ncbi:hypothetical protein MYX77_01090 [Acidobacteriia bacterium AH_259_A11_L15]|nr:hypothetical protein [Acidobacteriia bacterium AH_259_A11_L15]